MKKFMLTFAFAATMTAVVLASYQVGAHRDNLGEVAENAALAVVEKTERSIVKTRETLEDRLAERAGFEATTELALERHKMNGGYAGVDELLKN